MNSYPKIFAIGQKYILDIFESDVEVTEKVDGSQFGFGKINGELILRSKGQIIYPEECQKMFKEGVEYVLSIEDKLPEGMFFYAEYLKKRKHNTLMYERIPKNHLALFAVKDSSENFVPEIEKYAELLDIDYVPIIFKGKIENPEKLFELIKRESYLGGAEVEGVVVKNYEKDVLVGGQVMPIMAGKFVSEKFKEVHNKNWNKENNTKDRLKIFFEGFRTEARWEKAVQHLKEKGELLGEPKDIGKLMKEVNIDLINEEEENIKEWLWKEFKGQITRTSTKGLPEWYKEKLAKDSFEK